MIFFEYQVVICFCLIFFLLSFLLIVLSIGFGASSIDPEKLSTYECGFNPFENARKTYDIRFYIIAMVFIVFDVEVALLIPLVFLPFSLTFVGFCSILSFIFILILGFIYEWEKDVLSWV